MGKLEQKLETLMLKVSTLEKKVMILIGDLFSVALTLLDSSLFYIMINS